MSSPVDARLDTLFPNLPPQIGDFGRFERLDMMQADFLPQSWEELQMAFPLWLRQNVSGQTAKQHLDRVYIHQSQPDVHTDYPQAAVQFLTAKMGAYALQAQRDMHVLSRLRKDIVEFPEEEDSTRTFSQRFKGIPLFHGPGQLLRDLDVRRIARDHSEAGFDFSPLGGTVKPRLDGQLGVADPYTITQPPKAVLVHEQEVFDGYLASDSLQFIDAAMSNQFARLGFWNRNLVEATGNVFAQSIARPILSKLGLSSEFSPEAQDHLS